MSNEIIQNPRRRIVEDLKIRNKDNMHIVAQDYFGAQITYEKTFEMIENCKKAFVHLDGRTESPVTISAPSTIASVNALYGALDANKIVNMTGPGFLFAYTDKYTRDIGSKTVVILDSFLNEEYIKRLYGAGVKNVIIISSTDYMLPEVRAMIPDQDFLDTYTSEKCFLPSDMQFIRMQEFESFGAGIKENIEFPYEEDKIAAYFLTGATTSQIPKDVKLYADGFTKMAEIYDKLWLDFKPGDRQAIFIPMFYATGAIHAVHAGLFMGMTLSYRPKYDRFAFAKDLMETKAKLALVPPSHVATLESAGLPDNALSHLEYIFIGGEAIMPAQMAKFRKTAKRLGIKYILNGYGMTETGSMSGLSDRNAVDDDVTITPVPGVEYRIADTKTGAILPDNQRGILQKKSPCASAGYLDEQKNTNLFTADGWVNTGDIAERFSNGRYRVYGRSADYFENNNVAYPMYDIEEKVLEHPSVAEAEVIKFDVDGQERPAVVVVLNTNTQHDLAQIVKDICGISVSGMEHLLGVRFIDKFTTNPVTAKRNVLCLQDNAQGYFFADEYGFYCVDVGKEKRSIKQEEILIATT